MGKTTGKFLRRYWGYVALAVVITGWATDAIGYAVIAIISFMALIYFLFQAPLTCGAETRQGLPCRKNSRGILMGCAYRQHKWQKVRDILVTRRWRDVYHGLMGSTKDKLGTVSALISLLSVFVGLPLAFFK